MVAKYEEGGGFGVTYGGQWNGGGNLLSHYTAQQQKEATHTRIHSI
jgi:hypothetical protein